MNRQAPSQRSTLRLLAIHAAVTLVLVLALGGVLALSFRNAATRSGLAQGRSEATLIAQTAVEPELSRRPLSPELTAQERSDLGRLVHRAVLQRHVLRLRLRDLAGHVVFSDDGTGFGLKPDDEALTAAHGHDVSRLTHLNADGNDSGPRGVASVEVYLPLSVAGRPVGVLEIYLPYAPIARDVASGLHSLYATLAAGLAALYLVLLAITFSVNRGLRREAAINAFLARHDTLTELPNRSQFLTRAKAAVAHSEPQESMAIAVIDLDHFRNINETLGHDSGDQLLTELARRINTSLRPGDTVARLGSDEFGLILRDVEDAEAALQRLRTLIAAEVQVRRLPLSVEPTIGFVTALGNGSNVNTLLQHADIAMYAAKAQHARVLEYRPDLDQYDATSLGLVAELRHAIPAGQLVLHYQPEVDIKTHTVQTVEALVRWQHPTHGLLAPDRFLAQAEQTDLIDPLTEWVLATALTELKQLTPPESELGVAVNFSARSIVHPELATQVIHTLDRLDVAPHRLTVEVTETALLTDPAQAATTLTHLAEAGVKISIDDFGRGQTSLRYLSELPIDELKIDRSFVADMHQSPAHAAIVRSIIDLGHNLSIHVVAEGIETATTLATLRAYACDIAQGYFLGRPAPACELNDRLARATTAVIRTSS